MREFVSGFDWDTGNRAKCRKHGVSIDQIEGLFARPVMILPDPGHSSDEQRLRARGGEKFIRPISARYMHQSEIDSYEEDNPDL